MHFVAHRPPHPLSHFLDYLWYAEADETFAHHGSQFPTGGVDVLFNLGLPQGLRGQGAEVTWYRRSWVSGERIRPLHLVSPAGARLVGAHFHPGGAHPFFRLPLCELTEQVLDLDQFWPEAEALRERLALEPSIPGRFRILEASLLERLAEPEDGAETFVAYVLRALHDRSPGASLRRLSADVGVSERHLRRSFRERVGLGPKALHRVLRFQTVIRAVEAGTPHRWSTLAVRAGYYDQAHLISDFRDFTGITPRQYLALRSPDPNFATVDRR